jgi:hypothetical protein
MSLFTRKITKITPNMKYLLCKDYEQLCYKKMERGGREADSKNISAARV